VTARRLRVASVITSLGGGGTERSTALLLPELRSFGIDPVAVTLTRVAAGEEDRLVASGVPVVEIQSTNIVGRVRELRRFLRGFRPDVVHTAVFDADIAGRLAAVGLGIPVMSSLVNTSYDPVRLEDPRIRRHRLALVRWADGWTARHLTDHFHAVSSGVAAANIEHLRIDPSRITIVERGRDLSEFRPATERARWRAREELGVAGDAEVVATVGRQEFQKGHVDLVLATRDLVRSRPKLQVLIAGREGGASEAIRQVISENDLGRHVRMLGARADVTTILNAADIFALPSRYEGTAGAALEAMASGLPIVASELRGLEGIVVDGQTALLVPRGSPTRLAEGIDWLLEHVAVGRRLGANARVEALNRFGLDRSVAGMATLYRELASLRDR
jgi:glycosyltransferase involved in cell wall biosynthesis